MKHLLVTIIAVTLSLNILSQTNIYYYRVYFTDKKNTLFSIDKPNQFLSYKTIQKRKKFNIPITEEDFPVNRQYVDSLISMGCKLHNISKWFNTAVVTIDSSIIDKIKQLSFVKDIYLVSVKNVDTSSVNNKNTSKEKQEYLNKMSEYIGYNNNYNSSYNYGIALDQIEMLGGNTLHEKNYTANDIDIAVLDGGFYNYDKLYVLKNLIERNKVKKVIDFVDISPNAFTYSSHGTMVLSIMAACYDGQFVGTAPEANYWLFRTEDTQSETEIEEDNWTAAVEYADSAGIDIVNSSLGYTNYDIPFQNRTYSQFDGKTAYATKAANKAFEKGIIVIVSAGNSGDKDFKYIGVPADAKNAIAVGAVDRQKKRVPFSSIGPNASGDIKPDIVALGQAVAVVNSNGDFVYGNGTSFAAPLITGLTACLLQAHPEASHLQIVDAIKRSASQYESPDNWLGYGIPNFAIADIILSGNENTKIVEEKKLNIYPSPFNEQLNIIFYSDKDTKAVFNIYDCLGQNILSFTFDVNKGYNYKTISTKGINSNTVYIIRFNIGNTVVYKTLLKKER